MEAANKKFIAKIYDHTEWHLPESSKEASRTAAAHGTPRVIYRSRGKKSLTADSFVRSAHHERFDEELWKQNAAAWKENTSNTVQCPPRALQSPDPSDKETLPAESQLYLQPNRPFKAVDNSLKPSVLDSFSVVHSYVIAEAYIDTNLSRRTIEAADSVRFLSEGELFVSTNPYLQREATALPLLKFLTRLPTSLDVDIHWLTNTCSTCFVRKSTDMKLPRPTWKGYQQRSYIMPLLHYTFKNSWPHQAKSRSQGLRLSLYTAEQYTKSASTRMGEGRTKQATSETSATTKRNSEARSGRQDPQPGGHLASPHPAPICEKEVENEGKSWSNICQTASTCWVLVWTIGTLQQEKKRVKSNDRKSKLAIYVRNRNKKGAQIGTP